MLSWLTVAPYECPMDVADFDLNLLKAFDALYAERHVTHAGQRIGLSQSAMSGALTRLREVFKDELFIRSPTGMQPTPRADDLAGPVLAALRLMRDVLHADTFDPAAADHTVTVAMTDYAAFVLLPPLLARLAVEAPRLDVHVRGIFGRAEALDLLDNGEANLAIGFPVEVSARILVHPLLHEGFACIARRGHPAFAEGAGLEAFAAAPHLLVSPEGDRMGLVDHKLAALGLERRIVLSLPQFLVAPFVVADTDLVATLASRVARRFAAASLGIAVHEPPIALPGWPLAMMWHRRVDDHPATTWLRDRIVSHFKSIGAELNLKYIDPSYAIRSVPANPYDSVYCVRLAHSAVHAAMSGRTETVIGRWRGRFVHVPMALAIRQRNTVDPHGDLWMSVLEATGQPRMFTP